MLLENWNVSTKSNTIGMFQEHQTLMSNFDISVKWQIIKSCTWKTIMAYASGYSNAFCEAFAGKKLLSWIDAQSIGKGSSADGSLNAILEFAAKTLLRNCWMYSSSPDRTRPQSRLASSFGSEGAASKIRARVCNQRSYVTESVEEIWAFNVRPKLTRNLLNLN